MADIYFLVLLNEKNRFIPSSEMMCPHAMRPS